MMTDQELGRRLLEGLRDTRNPTQIEDLVALARSLGAEDYFQIQRAAESLHRDGLVADYQANPQAILARISDQGLAALDDTR